MTRNCAGAVCEAGTPTSSYARKETASSIPDMPRLLGTHGLAQAFMLMESHTPYR